MANESLKVRFGTQVRRHRLQKGLTQEQLAEALDVSIETVSHIERGVHGPRFSLIESIMDVLKVDVVDLFDDASQSDHY